VSNVVHVGRAPELELALERKAAPELPNAASEKAADLVPAGRDDSSGRGQDGADVHVPERPPNPRGDCELETRDRAAGPNDARELPQRCARIVDVAKQVRERERIERGIVERQALGARLDQLHGDWQVFARNREHLRALIDADDDAALLPEQLSSNRPRAGGDVQHLLARPGLDPGDEEPAPTRILAEREYACIALVGGAERSEELERAAGPGGGAHDGGAYARAVALTEDLRRIAEAAIRYAAPGEEVVGIVAAEPSSGSRAYLCAYRSEEGETSWVVLDDEGQPVADRGRVREVVSIAALVELAEETAGGGDLDEFRSQLVALRMTENPSGIDEAEEAALALQAAIGGDPRVATPERLDAIGVATLRLERSLGEAGSPFAVAMKQATATVEELTRDVEAAYKVALA
jgi:hypothetical protein